MPPSFRSLANSFRKMILYSGLDRALPSLTAGKTPDSILARLAPSNRLYRSPTLRRVERQGIRYELDLSQFMEWFIYFGIEVEPRDDLIGLVKLGAVVVDVGANVGEVAMKMARAAGSRGKVIAFEPGPETYSRIRKNLALNNFSNIELINKGLGEKEGAFRLVTPCATNSGGNRIDENARDGEWIQVTTLDLFLQEQPPERLDLVKIDVEGFERKVLEGAVKTIGRFHPDFFIELSDNNLKEQGSSAAELVAFLESFGYGIRNAQTGNQVFSADSFTDCHFDIICRAQK